MQIFIKVLVEPKQCFSPLTEQWKHTVHFDVEKDHTVEMIKEVIHFKTGMLPVEQKLWFGCDLREAKKTLHELNITHESTLLLYHSNQYPPTISTPSMLVAKAVFERRPLEDIKRLLDLKGDPNSRYQDTQAPSRLQETALHYACWARDGDKGDGAEVAKLLLERKANVHAIADPFGTPLHFASHYAGETKTIQVLLKHGANPWSVYHGFECETGNQTLSGKCSICLERHEKETSRALLPCLHIFHLKCLQTLQTKTKKLLCPLCRSEILQACLD